MFVVVNVQVSLVNSTMDVISSSTMYIAPPFVAAQSLNFTAFNVRVFDAGMLTYTAPPFPDMHLHEVNVMLDRDSSSSLALVNSNTAPFPLQRVMEVKETSVTEEELVRERSE